MVPLLKSSATQTKLKHWKWYKEELQRLIVCGDSSRRSSVTSILASWGRDTLQRERQIHQLTTLHKMIKVIEADRSHIVIPKPQRLRRGNSKQFKISCISSTIYEQCLYCKIVLPINQSSGYPHFLNLPGWVWVCLSWQCWVSTPCHWVSRHTAEEISINDILIIDKSTEV